MERTILCIWGRGSIVKLPVPPGSKLTAGQGPAVSWNNHKDSTGIFAITVLRISEVSCSVTPTYRKPSCSQALG